MKAITAVGDYPSVGIVMGSDSDLPIMQEALETLVSLGISAEITVASAHRSPARASQYARAALKRGLKVIIAGAGGAAHLAGILAAETTLPVIGVPIGSSPLGGWDALLATVQMPAGIPVATMAVGKAGARNAAILAAQILAVGDSAIRERLRHYKQELARKVEEKAASLEEHLRAKQENGSPS
ncbi:MAG: 5-(carboxyamino)imidazole ribonucleotide mutase [Deltaproteobacteria bacterium]|nr:5-(carboxyamino)imidazole ribonucleotide mutase [Deltaproteobacteria bacterium]MBW2071262.1 5-(carboxyamino)imidazole ribonucleotide mutase [Deltaproteobacteria bacterium]